MNTPSTDPLDSRASWRVLGGGGLAFVFGVPALFGSTFGLFMLPLSQSQGWGRAEIAFSMTLATVAGLVAAPLGGWLLDRVRLVPFFVIGVVLGAANLAAFSLVTGNVWTFHLLVVLLGFTTMGASPLAVAKIVQGWFRRRLGTALGLLFACGAVGTIVHPPIVQSVIGSGGWRQAFVVMGAMALGGGLLAALLALREAPRAAPAPAPAPEAAAAPAPPRAPMIEFLRSPLWWKLALWNLLFAFGSGAIFVHFAALLAGRGLAPAQVAATMSLVGVGLLAGNLAAGWLVDRMSPQRLAWLLMLMPLAATLLLLAGSPSQAMALAAAMLFGLSSGSDGSLSAFLARHYFGPVLFGQASATQMVATALGGGIAPWLSGLMFDRTGSYTLSLTVAAAAFAGAVVAGRFLPRAGHGDAAAAGAGAAADRPAAA